MRKTKLSKLDAYRLAKRHGIKFSLGDSDRQDMSAMRELHKLANRCGYHRPPYASGSTARYFFYHLLKLKRKRGWK